MTISWIRNFALGTVVVAAFAGGCGGDGGDGKNGAKGDTGDAGLPGNQGPAGEGGPQGQPGDTGEAGPQGQPGDPGEAGVPGQNVYVVGPGLDLKVDKVDISSSGEAVVTFTVKDAAGTPLDVNGKYTLGAITARFVLGWLGADSNGAPTQYTSYTTNSSALPSADSGGTFADLGNGKWTYTLKTSITVADQTKTHAVGAYATRVFDGKTYVANDVFAWVPGGGTPLVRELVKDDACNKCHGTLKAHGSGARRQTQLCAICHTAGNESNGNTIDFRVMIHKIHMGKDLPSVVAGGSYAFGANHDYSTVAFPTWHEVNSCDTCHAGAQQGDRWKTAPTREVCTSCHDLTSFEQTVPTGFTAHSGGAQTNTTCGLCHKAGGLSPIDEKHLTADKAADFHKVEATIDAVQNTGPGQAPILFFSIKKDGAAADILASPMNSLNAVIAGPNPDYAGYKSYSIQGSAPVGTLEAGATAGSFKYTFPAGSIPANATGSWSIGLEGYYQDTSASPRSAMFNPIVAVAVTDATAKARREVVDTNNCTNCHRRLSAHGGSRTNAQYCNFCHNANNANDDRISRFESSIVVAQPVHLKAMVHSIHMGEELTQPYVLGGFPAPSKANPAGTPIDFGEVRYPRPRNDCAACHKSGTWNLPVPTGALPTLTQTLVCTEDPSADSDSYCDQRNTLDSYMRPESAACTSCHDAPSAKAHAQLNTTASGLEACATCHGSGKAFDINEAHALAP